MSSQEPLARITFSAYPTCHDVNRATLSPERMDVIIGFTTGDLVWFGERARNCYLHQRDVKYPHRSYYKPVRSTQQRSTCTRPSHPHSANKTKQGCITSSPCTAVRWVPQSPTLFLVAHADGTILVYDKEREDFTSFTPSEPVGEDGGEWDPNLSIYITMPPWHPAAGTNATGVADEKERKEREKEKAKNPVSHWRVAKRSIVGELFPSSLLTHRTQ
jgi:catabolite repression protein CreC